MWLAGEARQFRLRGLLGCSVSSSSDSSSQGESKESIGTVISRAYSKVHGCGNAEAAAFVSAFASALGT